MTIYLVTLSLISAVSALKRHAFEHEVQITDLDFKNTSGQSQKSYNNHNNAANAVPIYIETYHLIGYDLPNFPAGVPLDQIN